MGEDLYFLPWLDGPYPGGCRPSGMTREAYGPFDWKDRSWVAQISLEECGYSRLWGSPVSLSTALDLEL